MNTAVSRSMRTTTRFGVLTLLLAVGIAGADGPATVPDKATAVDQEVTTGTETIVFLRHGEKPAEEIGQLSPQGLNRALALVTVLPAKFGKPDYLFAPDPAAVKISKAKGASYDYIRPLATIEPTAIALDMPVQTEFGFSQIDKLNAELTKPVYTKSTIFVAWEHGYEQKAAAELVKQFGGDPKQVPHWEGKDFDSLYVVRIIREAGHPAKVTFKLDHEGLDGQSKSMPTPKTGG